MTDEQRKELLNASAQSLDYERLSGTKKVFRMNHLQTTVMLLERCSERWLLINTSIKLLGYESESNINVRLE